MGKQVLTKNAANQHEVLEENLYISEDGYIETFVINETPEDVWFDDFMVMSTTSPIMQETHYDPWGLELTGIGFQYGGIKANKYLYQGKELMDDHSLNIYDFHARGYDPVIGRTWQLDPHSENYFSLSPYSWTANNPVLHIDPDGKDYRLNFDHENGRVVVSGNFYAMSGDVSSAQASVDYWNGQSGFSYTVGNVKNAVSYEVSFDLRVTEVEGGIGELNSALTADLSGEGNIYMVVGEDKSSLLGKNNGQVNNGSTKKGREVFVREDRRDTQTGAHEVGHALGMVHSKSGSSIMRTGGNYDGKANNPARSDLRDMINYPLKGSINSEGGNPAGRGTLRNSTPIVPGNYDYLSGGMQRTAPTPSILFMNKGKVRR